AQGFRDVFPRIQAQVLPSREKKAKKEQERNKILLASDPKMRVNLHHTNFLRKWWLFSYAREEMIAAIGKLPRYIACARVTKRPIFDFVSSKIHPNDALQVFALDDDYSFGILQSSLHWVWFTERCSTLKSDPRYTSNTVFDSFPWPQNPSVTAVKKVACAAVSL